MKRSNLRRHEKPKIGEIEEENQRVGDAKEDSKLESKIVEENNAN